MTGRFASLDDRERVLDATDIVHLISEHLTLKARGREFVGLCPFHDDHKPSLTIVPHKQIYKCFSCGAGGDAITFVREYHGMTFPEALRYLAERAGIELSRPEWKTDQDRAPAGGSRADLLAANAGASEFFRTILGHRSHGEAARELIARRRLDDEIVQRFGLGAAPDIWDGLARTMASRGTALAGLEAAGLLKRRSDGSFFDTFRHRLIFPIHDQIGSVIAFGGRRIRDEDEPKYLNSPESRVFKKSSALYALHQAARSIQQSGVAVVTEGYMDAIACHQAGFTNVVATLGTSLTVEHGRMLKRLCSTVILLFDADEAGQRAADRAVEVFFAEPIDVKIAVLGGQTGAKDPDELLKSDGGSERFRRMLDGAIDAIEFRMVRLRERIRSGGLSARAGAIGEEMRQLAELGLDDVEPVRRQLIIRRLASIVGVDEASIRSQLPRRRGDRSARRGQAESGESPATSRSQWTSADYLTGCVLSEPSLLLSLEHGVQELVQLAGYASPDLVPILGVVSELTKRGDEPTLSAVLSMIEDLRLQRLATDLATTVDALSEGDAGRIGEIWRSQLHMAKRRLVRAQEGSGGQADACAEEDEIAAIKKLQEAQMNYGDNPLAVPEWSAGLD